MPSLRFAVLLSALSACSAAGDPVEEREWQAYIKDLGHTEEPAVPAKTSNPSNDSWLDLYISSYDPWLSTGLGEFPHRPSWSAERRLMKDIRARFQLPRTFLDLEPNQTRVPPEVRAYLAERLGDPDWCVRSLCAWVFGECGPEAVREEEALKKALRDPHFMVRASATRAYAAVLGRKALPELREMLRDPEEFVRLAAASAFVRMGEPEEAVTTVLIHASRNPGKMIRARATASLTRVVPPPIRALDALRECLKDPDVWVRGNAAVGIGRMGNAAKVALPELLRLAAEDPNPDVRRSASEAAEAIR